MLRLVSCKNQQEGIITEEAKQIFLREPSHIHGTTSNSVPKVFSFDQVFSSSTLQKDICANVLTDLLTTVVNGNDACLLTYGYPKLG